MVYGLLSGDHPFLRKANVNFDDMRKIFAQQNANFDQQIWMKVSPECRDLVKSLLIKNPEDRLNMEEVLSHPWFADMTSQ